MMSSYWQVMLDNKPISHVFSKYGYAEAVQKAEYNATYYRQHGYAVHKQAGLTWYIHNPDGTSYGTMKVVPLSKGY